MKMVHVLYGSLVAAAVIAGVRSFAGSPPPANEPALAAAEPAAPAPAAFEPQRPADDEVQAPAGGISGEVLEVIDVPSYSYLRVGAKGTDGTWAAVPTASVKVGAAVQVTGAMKMTDFQSKALGRTFPVIYFGTLGDGASARTLPPATGDNPHGAGANPHGMGADPHGMGAGPTAADPHAGMNGAAPAAAPVDVKPLARAEGPNGKTVADVIGQRTTLSGKAVKIRGTVVKVNTGILGRTYLHLRDGSGDAAAGTNDIVVTTEATPTLGETVVVEGKVVLDRDIGSGYKVATMVEDAKVL